MHTSTLPLPPPGEPPLQNDARPKDRRWRFRLVALALAGATALTLAFVDRSPLGAIVALFVLVVPFEKLFPRHRGQKLRRRAVGTDLSYALATPVLQFLSLLVILPVAVLSFAWLPGLALRPFVAAIPSSAQPFVAFVLFDFVIYWVHRWSHDIPLLWRFHSIHHSPETMDWVSGFRNHPVDGAILAPPFVFLLAAGFSPQVTGALAVVQVVLGIFLHANVRWRLRPLHRLVITPEFHHWHHSSEDDAISTNHSVFLPLWDIVFGTYHMPADRRPQRYGVDEPIPSGMAAQLLHPFRGMPNPLRQLRHPVRAVRLAARHIRSLAGDIVSATHRRRAVRLI